MKMKNKSDWGLFSEGCCGVEESKVFNFGLDLTCIDSIILIAFNCFELYNINDGKGHRLLA